MANINNYNDFLYEFMRANPLKKAKMGMQYPEYMSSMLRDQLAKEGKRPGEGKYNTQTKRVETPQQQQTVNKAQQKLDEALTREGLKKATQATPKVTSTAKNIIKGGANAAKKAASGVIAGALDIPTTIGNWTREGASNLSRGLDVAGNAMTIASPYALKIPGWRGKLASGLLLGAGQGAHYLSDRLIDNNQQQPTPTTQEIIEAGRLANQEANDLQAQARNQINQTQEAIDFYNNFDERMSPGNYSPSPTIQELNMRLPEAPTTGVNTSGNMNRPISNLTPVPGQSGASNQNQTGNINMSNQQPMQYQPTNNDMANLMNNIQMLSSYTRGVQQGNQLPDLGVTNEELQAYSNALEQYRKSVANARVDVEAYRKAMQRNVKAQGIAGMLDAAGNIVDALTPMQNMYTFNMAGNFVGAPAPTRDSINLGDTLRGVSNRQLENIKNELAINEQLRKTEQDRATAFADLLTATRLSNQTGLPLNVARQMTPENYLNYIKPVQEAQNKAQEIALQGVQDLITGKQQQVADYAKALDTQALTNTGAYEREALSQLGQNKRAQLEALTKTNIAKLDAQTRRYIIDKTGLNQQQLEQLKQSDPNAFYRAIGPVLMAATYTTGPSSNLAGNYIYTLLNQLYPQGGQQSGGMTPDAQSYWNNFNK